MIRTNMAAPAGFGLAGFCNVKAVAAATTPTVADPFIHKKMAQPTIPTISKPFRNTRLWD